MRKTKGFKSGTRNKLKAKSRSKINIIDYLREYEIGEKVIIKLQPSSKKGMPHPKFKAIIGKIKEKRGKAYLVTLKDGKKEKTIISNPEHLKPLKK